MWARARKQTPPDSLSLARHQGVSGCSSHAKADRTEVGYRPDRRFATTLKLRMQASHEASLGFYWLDSDALPDQDFISPICATALLQNPPERLFIHNRPRPPVELSRVKWLVSTSQQPS